ncbi:MAG: hypothetical protein WC894_05735 [Patescibacteria group bacterium]
MDFTIFNNSLECWFINRQQSEFPDSTDYVGNYRAIVNKLKEVHSEVNAGADFKDETTLTRHDSSHINKVIYQISKLLSYEAAKISPFETFHLLVAVQIHDVKNIESREGHENSAVQIFNDLGISGLIDTRLLKNIGYIASCHAGSYARDGKKEKDKIGYLLPTFTYKDAFQIRPQYLAALLRLADEYADETARAMTYLLKIEKVKKASIIHQKHAESLRNVAITKDSGIVEFDYYIKREDALVKFPKYIKEIDTWEDKYLLDEIFERTVKSHYETIYCMRFLRPYISVNKINVCIEIEKQKIDDKEPIPPYELIEKGYPNDSYTIVDLCGEVLKKNGGYWSGENLKDYLTLT